MTATTLSSLGFQIRSADLVDSVLVPRYYDHQLRQDLAGLGVGYSPITLGSLVEEERIVVQTGHEVGKMAYGTGDIPFIRTSDLSNWELKSDPKHAVSEAIYEEYSQRQSAAPGDIFLVRDGTYLIGTSAVITESDLPILFQSHLVRFRIAEGSPLNPFALLALLNAPIVQRQIRAKQFTADIIDTIGNRYLEIVLPIPEGDRLDALARDTERIVERRAFLRKSLGELPDLLVPPAPELEGVDAEPRNLGFRTSSQEVGQMFMPKYHDPALRRDVAALEADYHLKTIGDLVKAGALSVHTGVEVGKMAYATGDVPFVRTSDISNFELKTDPKQRVNPSYLVQYPQGADVQGEDILLVRDGTYLVGKSAMVTDDDLPMLFAGGIYQLRCERSEVLDPYLLLLLLNTQIVKRQLKARQFTRDIIDTLGRRIFEVQLPVPADDARAVDLALRAREAINERAKLRRDLESLFSSLP